MKDVSEFEAMLLRILRCLMHRASVDQTLSLLVKHVPRPRCLSRDCVELVQDALSKGVTEWLARSGWTMGRFVQASAISSGRLWQRHSPESMRLSFSPNSMELLIWLTSENFADPLANARVDSESLSLGDRLLFLMAFAALRSTLGGPVLMKQPGFCGHGLIELLFPANVAVMADSRNPDLRFWCQADRSWVLEALQSRLSQQWFRIEHDKRSSSNPDDLRKIGELQTVVLNELFSAAEQCGRKDLCVFLLMAGRQLLQTISADRWFERLDLRSLRMADRAAVYRAGLAFFQAIQRLHRWTQQAQAVGFYDEDYRASQLWKSEWEQLGGDQMHQRAQRIIEIVDPLRTVTASEK